MRPPPSSSKLFQLYHCSSILKIDRIKSRIIKTISKGVFLIISPFHKKLYPFQTGAVGRLLRVLFARCSEWNFGEYYFQENFDDFNKAQSKKAVIPKNTVSCNSRCFWVSRRLVSFLESSEQISRFGAAFKKPPPKRRFLSCRTTVDF